MAGFSGKGGDAACCAGIEQHFGVFMLRIGEDFGGFAGFEDAAVTHNGDVVGKTAHDGLSRGVM